MIKRMKAFAARIPIELDGALTTSEVAQVTYNSALRSTEAVQWGVVAQFVSQSGSWKLRYHQVRRTTANSLPYEK